MVKGSGLTGCCVKIFQFVVAPTSYLFHLTSAPLVFHLPCQIRWLSAPIRAYMKYFHLSRGREKFLSWGRKISIFIDDTKVQKIIETTKYFTNYFS